MKTITMTLTHQQANNLLQVLLTGLSPEDTEGVVNGGIYDALVEAMQDQGAWPIAIDSPHPLIDLCELWGNYDLWGARP